MLKDKIYRASTVETTQTTELLPYDFFRKYIPLSLEVEDTFDISSHVPIDTDVLKDENGNIVTATAEITKLVKKETSESESEEESGGGDETTSSEENDGEGDTSGEESGGEDTSTDDEPTTPTETDDEPTTSEEDEYEEVTEEVDYTPQAGFAPKRVFYLDDIKCYLILDVGNPHMAVIYLIDGETHKMLTSYTYLVESYPNYKLHDEIVDVCVHHINMQDKITVTFLIINNYFRTATLATYRLAYSTLGQLHNEGEGGPVFQINLLDLVHFADIIPSGKRDEIALGYELVNNHPEFQVDELIPLLKTNLFIGELVPKYCNVTSDDKGRFIILLGTRIKVWMGPLLPFHVDAQYIVIMDKGGMNQRFRLLSPQDNAISFDERQEHQPYKYSLSAWDGRYLLCLEDRKCRFLNPKRNNSGSNDSPESQSYVLSTGSWDGGAKADLYYPSRQSGLGYPTIWDDGEVRSTTDGTVITINPETNVMDYDLTDPKQEKEYFSRIDPVQREAVWTTIEICDLFKEITAPEETPEPPYSADVLFLVDDSSTMETYMSTLQGSISMLLTTLNSLGVTDVRVGGATYQTNQHELRDNTSSPPAQWATTSAGAQNILNQLALHLTKADRPADENPQNVVDHWSSLKWAVDNYTWRTEVNARVIVLVTDTNDEIEGYTIPEAYLVPYPNAHMPTRTAMMMDANTALQNKDINLFVAGRYPNTFNAIITGTDGGWQDLTTNSTWGSGMANKVAQLILSKIEQHEDSGDWWAYIAKNWGPVIYYNYTPQLDFARNSLVTIFHDDVTFIVNKAVVRNKINWLACYDDYPVLGGEPQDSFYLPGLIPNETITRNFVIRNESYSGTMKQIKLTLLDKPDDVSISITNWPTTLKPRQTTMVTIKATYKPQDGSETPPSRHVDIHYELSYWMTHVMACSEAADLAGEEDAVVPTTDSALYFAESTQPGKFSSGFQKSITFDPLYTLAYTTKTEYKEDDLTEQESWTDRLYILTKDTVNSTQFERVKPVPITAIAGYDVSTTGCCWLKVRGPVVWTTTRDYECKVNVKTWYLINQSTDYTYVAHPVMDSNTLPDHLGMGFLLIEYPNGNIIPPGEARPVTLRWQPIFNPSGENMTQQVTRPAVKGCQDDAVESIWSLTDGFFNNILYAMAQGYKDSAGVYHPDYDTKFTHTYIENISGDGMDIPIRADQPLQKMDVKGLLAAGTSYSYGTKTYLDVDLDDVQNGFQFLSRAGIWMGVKDDPEANDLSLPLGAKPSDMFDYVEWISPASGLEDVPQYIDHKFKPNPDYTFNANTAHPYQLTPFNKEYANPYMATIFMGNELMRTETIAFTRYKNMQEYAGADLDLVPCDSSGNEKAGWLLQNFWPVAGDRDASIKRLATENDYIFTRTVYVKNRSTTETYPVVLDYDSSVVNGLSVQAITIISNPILAPGAVATLSISWRLHYTYQESKYINLVKDILYVPVFKVE